MHRLSIVALAVVLAGCASSGSQQEPSWPQRVAMEYFRVPDTIPTRWRGIIGEYGEDTASRWYALEREGRMWILDHQGNYVPLGERPDSVFVAPLSTAPVSGEVIFHRDSAGRAQRLTSGRYDLARRNIEPPPGTTQLKVTPQRPIAELRREALQATPPVEAGPFEKTDLVDITTLDSTIRLDVRYATDNNFLGTPLYEQARVFMQRPAAEALVRANRVLRTMRYTIMVFDAYRPWYVTKVFWDATPDSLRWLVADPTYGSKHNRGAAVDLTLYDLETKKPVEMPSTYDETTTRARADYPGGTSLQRYYRGLLRTVMEHEGFVVNPLEWWHFDYRDWRKYAIGNVPFDRVDAK